MKLFMWSEIRLPLSNIHSIYVHSIGSNWWRYGQWQFIFICLCRALWCIMSILSVELTHSSYFTALCFYGKHQALRCGCKTKPSYFCRKFWQPLLTYPFSITTPIVRQMRDTISDYVTLKHFMVLTCTSCVQKKANGRLFSLRCDDGETESMCTIWGQYDCIQPIYAGHPVLWRKIKLYSIVTVTHSSALLGNLILTL